MNDNCMNINWNCIQKILNMIFEYIFCSLSTVTEYRSFESVPLTENIIIYYESYHGWEEWNFPAFTVALAKFSSFPPILPTLGSLVALMLFGTTAITGISHDA